MKRLVGLTAMALWLPTTGLWAQAPEPRSSCEVCHSTAAAAHAGSAHAKGKLSCVDCHGGDPRDFSVTSMSPARGFRGKPARRDIPAFCGSCHSRPDQMRPYGLPTSQLAEYQTSNHGQAVAAGRTRAAVCTDCHTAHAIRPASDPLSSVAPAKVPATCGRCHDDAALMKSVGLTTEQYRPYLNSAHGKALLEGGNKAAPNCASCHGSHGAAPPRVASIQHVCGQCHPNTYEAFEAGPHGAAAAAGKMTPCVSCHTAHDNQHPTDEMLLTNCAKCHDGDPAVTALTKRIHDEVAQSRQLYEADKKLVEEGLGGVLNTEAMQAELGESKTALLQVPVAQHSVRLRDVERLTVVVRATDEDIHEAAQDYRDRLHLRYAILLYVWGFLAVSVTAMRVSRQRGIRDWWAGRNADPGVR